MPTKPEFVGPADSDMIGRAGVPAKMIRPRFVPAIVVRIDALAWWDWAHERLRTALGDVRRATPTEFLARHDG